MTYYVKLKIKICGKIRSTNVLMREGELLLCKIVEADKKYVCLLRAEVFVDKFYNVEAFRRVVVFFFFIRFVFNFKKFEFVSKRINTPILYQASKLLEKAKKRGVHVPALFSLFRSS